MSIVAVRNLESRSKFFLVCIAIFATYSLIYTFGVLRQESSLQGITLDRYIVFFLNALLTLLAYPLIYLFEKLFGFTTNLTLMELSSTNTPALRELPFILETPNDDAGYIKEIAVVKEWMI